MGCVLVHKTGHNQSGRKRKPGRLTKKATTSMTGVVDREAVSAHENSKRVRKIIRPERDEKGHRIWVLKRTLYKHPAQ